jgi:hypothetical protein
MSQRQRKDMPAHEQNDKLHLHMTLDTVSIMQDRVSRLQDTVSTLQEAVCVYTLQDQCLTLKNDNSESMTFAVSGYQKMKEAGDTFISPSFYTHPNGYLMVMEVVVENVTGAGGLFSSKVNKVNVGEVSIRVQKASHNAELKWPFRGKVKTELLNQLADRNHRAQTEEVVLHDGEKTRCLSITSTPANQYLIDDTLYFRVSVEVDGQKPWLKCSVK